MPIDQEGQLKIYRSSAGSGKTFTLAKEYLKIALTHREVYHSTETEDYFRHILAITFTNDAANEMKERVLKYLHEFSELEKTDTHPMLEAIVSDIASERPDFRISKEEITKRSGIILSSILHRYSEFNIQTIDSFTNQVARSFSRELGLPGNYEIYLDTQLKLDEAVDVLLSGISDKEKSLMDWLFRFVEGQIDQDRSWNIGWQLRKFAVNLVDERRSELLSKVANFELDDFSAIRKKLHEEKAKLESQVKKIAQTGLDLLEIYNLDHVHLHYKKTGIKAFFEICDSAPFSKLSNRGSNDGLGKDKWLNKVGEAFLGNRISEFEDGIRAIAIDLVSFLESNNQNHRVYKAVLENLYQLALLNRINQILTELKDRDDQAFLSDLNARIRDVVMKEPIPFIYERAGVKYKHLLIDEFQDTSLFQWINLVPLISNAMAEGNVNLIVGDAKQSIYAWRGGRPELLVNLPDMNQDQEIGELDDHLGILKRNSASFQLDSNWRSAPEIVNFNNDLFSHIAATYDEFPELKNFYSDIAQTPKQKGEADIRIDVFQTEKSHKKHQIQDLKDDLIISYIEECRAKGYAWRDIAILCRNHSDIYRVTEILVENKIYIISEESLLLRNSPVVDLLLKVFELFYEPDNEEIRFALFVSLINIKENQVDDWEDIRHHIKHARLPDYLDFLLKYFNIKYDKESLLNGSVFSIGSEWLRAFNLSEIQHEQVYIDYFLDLLFEKSKSETAGIGDFLKYWEEKGDKLAIASSAEQNAVRIMTIHKAKGLEFPVVIIPYPEWQYAKPGGQLWVQWDEQNPTDMPIAVVNSNKDLEETEFERNYVEDKQNRFLEELNSLYVATTRAESRLYIIASDLKRSYASELITDYLENKGIEYQEHNTEGHSIHRFQLAKQNEKASEKIEAILEPWNNASYDRVKLDKHLRWSVDFALDEEKLAYIEKGKIWHALMENLKYRDDKTAVLTQAKKYLSDEGDYAEFESMINNMLKSIELSFMFRETDDIRTEMEMIGNGELLRPDRVQVSEKEVVVVDYKTGEKRKEHKEQVARYMETLKQVYPDKKVSGVVLYTDDLQLISINNKQ